MSEEQVTEQATEQARGNAMSQSFRLAGTGLHARLWESQAGLCALCGRAMPKSRFEVAHASIWKRERPTIDHIVPRAAGGPDVPENLQLTHARCNRVKGRVQPGPEGRDRT